MKKFRLLAAIAVLAMFMTSCEMFGEGGQLGGDKKARFTAYTETPDRTTMGDNYTVVWSEGDQIVMFGTNPEYQLTSLGAYTLVEGAGTTTGVFEGELDQEYPLYAAFYPLNRFEQGANYDGKMMVTLPHNDAIFAERGFVDNANPMAAIGTKDGGLQFRNLCGILEIQLKGSGTINSIKVEVGTDDPYISGYFVVDPSTSTLHPYNVAKYINATLAYPIELSATTSRSVYAIIPPGEYKDLRITTIDNNGNITTRKATNTINIERSKITPISEFEHQTIEVPSVQVTYLEEKSNFERAWYKVNINSLAVGAYRYLVTKSYYDQLISEGKTDAQLVMDNGVQIEESGDYYVNVSNVIGKEVYIMAAPYDEQGNISGEIVKCSFAVKNIPINNDYSIAYEDSEITANSMDVNFSYAVPAEGIFTASLYTMEDYNNLTEDNKELYSIDGYAHFSLPYTGGIVNIKREGLLPNTDYVLIYRVANGVSDNILQNTYTGYSEYNEFMFKTKEYNKSNATVQMSIVEVKDWTISLNFTTSNAERVKVWYTTFADTQDLEHHVDCYGTEVDLNTGHTFTGLIENTTYYIHAIAYDANGIYGDVTSVTATTTALTPEQNSEYDKFVGTYSLSAVGTDGTPVDARTVTITKGIDGKTLLVKGLLAPRFTEQYSVADDTFVARFYDNMIHIGGSEIADIGQTLANSLGTGYSIYASAASKSGLYWPGEPVASTYNDGVMTFVNRKDQMFTGLIFYIGQGVGSASNFIELYVDMVLTKQGGGNTPPSTTGGNATENFTRGDEVTAGWR